ncbi:MAG: hypothetical protein E7Z85_08730 [Methanosphaera stadtmanae]|nr:hypothetical protein [Methanosphaera stadtmanae]
MYVKRMNILIVFALSTIILTGFVSALNINQSCGADLERGIVIEDIEFNIPDGYEKNNSKSIVNQTNTTGNMSFVLNQETFTNPDNSEITISIVDYNDFDVDAESLKKICEDADNKTLMGYPGYISNKDSYSQFTYAFNNKAVSIRAPNEDLINQILVVEDA